MEFQRIYLDLEFERRLTEPLFAEPLRELKIWSEIVNLKREFEQKQNNEY